MNMGLSVCLALFVSLIPSVMTAQAPSSAQGRPDLRSQDYLAKESYVFESIQNRVRFEAEGKGQRDVIFRVRIQSESSVREFGLLAYPFAASFETLDVVYARVRKPDGTVIETPAADVQELDSAVSREAPMYTDEREKHLAIKSLSVGDILEVHFRWTVHDPITPGHFWYDHSYFRDGVCLQEILEIDVPSSSSAKIRNSDPQPSVQEQNGRRVYHFERSNPQKPRDTKIPAWEKDYHGLQPPDVQMTSFASWEEVGRWFNSLAQPKVTVSREVRSKAEELTKGKSSEDEKIRAIYDFVSTRFRYIGIDLGLSRYTPHAASDVLTNRFGDCKDKHTLFAALLQSVDIASYPALVSSKYHIDDSFPSVSLFDHVITLIPRADSFLFADTTPEVAPFGLLIRTIRDRQVLVVANSGPARLVTTPADPPFPNYEHFNIDSSIDEHGTLDAKMRLEERGDDELGLRLAYRATPQNSWQELTQRIVGGMGFAGSVSDVSVIQPEDTSHPFWLTFTYHRTDFPEWKNHRILLPSPFFFLAQLTEEQKLSKDPLPLGALQDVTFDATVKFPKGYSAVLQPVPTRKTDFAEFTSAYSFEKGVLHGTLHLKTLLHEVPGKERSNFSDMAKAVSDAQSRFIFVTGNFPLIAGMAPSALFGLPIGKTEDRIPQLEKILADDPDNDAALMILSRAYTEVGRPADSVALLKKTIESHPDIPRHVHMALGQAYLRLPETEKAMVEFKSALGDDPDPEELNSAAYALAEAGVHLPEALDYSTRAVSSLSSKTMDISPDDAAASDFSLMPNLAANWDTLGWIKFRMGDLPGAERYIAAAWELMQAPAIGEHLVEVYEKLGKKEKAATICNMALSAGASSGLQEKLTDEMARLRPVPKTLKGQTSPSAGPDGGMALSDMRTLKIRFQTKLQGNSRSANLVISLVNGVKTGEIVFVSGAEELRNSVAALASAKYPQSFPDDTPTRILRKAILSCSIYTPECFLVLMPTPDAAVPVPFPHN
jgi:uncharacterized protein DUF3857/transglutaminase superfamily protein/tetratricopeptide repeat protein